MKIYNEKPQKSWRIRLLQMNTNFVILAAVDSTSSKIIAHLINFDLDSTRAVDKARDALEHEGYDAFEHSSNWDRDGKLIVE